MFALFIESFKLNWHIHNALNPSLKLEPFGLSKIGTVKQEQSALWS